MVKKIVFMGTPMFAVPILKSLYQNGYPISNVYTQPPQKSQRGQKINKSPIQGIAETLNLEFRTPQSLKNNLDEYEYFRNINADLVIVVAYGQIIPKNFLELSKKGLNYSRTYSEKYFKTFKRENNFNWLRKNRYRSSCN